jgi:hypothetical protein
MSVPESQGAVQGDSQAVGDASKETDRASQTVGDILASITGADSPESESAADEAAGEVAPEGEVAESGEADPEATEEAATEEAGEPDELAQLREQVAGLSALLRGEKADDAKSDAKAEGKPDAKAEEKADEPSELDKILGEQFGDEGGAPIAKAIRAEVARLVGKELAALVDAIEPDITHVRKGRVQESETAARTLIDTSVTELVKSTPALASLYGANKSNATAEQARARAEVFDEAKAIVQAMTARGLSVGGKEKEIMKQAELLVRAKHAQKLTAPRKHGANVTAALDTRKGVTKPAASGTSKPKEPSPSAKVFAEMQAKVRGGG